MVIDLQQSSSPKKEVKIFSIPGVRNFGDNISPIIIDKIFGANCKLVGPSDCDIVAAGSVIEMVLIRKKNNRPFLWGSGLMFDADIRISSDDFTILALRGNFSRSRVQGSTGGITLGDPGILANYLLETMPKKTARLGVVPHISHSKSPVISRVQNEGGVKVIDLSCDPRTVVRQIAECECILSSSLHGLIASDSLGVPNAHVEFSNKLLGDGYKFLDYYSSFEHSDRHLRLDADLLADTGPDAVADWIFNSYREPAGIEKMKTELIRSFPF